MSDAKGGRPREVLLAGCGKMGVALLRGWLDRDVAGHFTVVDPAGRPAGGPESSAVDFVADVKNLAADFDPQIIVLAVKPQIMGEVLPDYRRFGGRSVFLSIAAGRTLAYFANDLGEDAAVVRAMPNTPAAIGRGISGLCASPAVTPTQRALCETLLQAVGRTVWVADDAAMDVVTALSGSGPAYLFLMIESLAAAGVSAGLPEGLAAELAVETIAGSAELARQSSEDPARLRENVTSPGGTTRAALDVLMASGGLRDLLTRAVAAAARRSRELAE